MADVYIDFYSSDLSIDIASVAAYFPLANGNDDVVYKTILKKDQAANIDLGSGKATLEPTTLPNNWAVSYSISRFQ